MNVARYHELGPILTMRRLFKFTIFVLVGWYGLYTYTNQLSLRVDKSLSDAYAVSGRLMWQRNKEKVPQVVPACSNGNPCMLWFHAGMWVVRSYWIDKNGLKHPSIDVLEPSR